MKTLAPLLCLAAIMTGYQMQAQIMSNSDRASERYQQRLIAAEKVKTDAIANLTMAYDAEVKAAQDEVKRAIEPLIRAAALRSQTEEVRILTLQMEAIMNPDGVDLSAQESAGPNGNSFKQLLGKWETSDSRNQHSRSFEFKSPRTVTYTTTYPTQGGGKSTQTEDWKATTRADKILIERKDNREYSHSYKEWYEIKIPFETTSLEITRFSESDGRSSNESFHLERKK